MAFRSISAPKMAAACVVITIAALLAVACQHTAPGSSRTYRLVAVSARSLPYGDQLTNADARQEAYDVMIYAPDGRQTDGIQLRFDSSAKQAVVYTQDIRTGVPVACSRPEEAVDIYLAGKLPVVGGTPPAGPNGSTLDYDRAASGGPPADRSVNSGRIGATR